VTLLTGALSMVPRVEPIRVTGSVAALRGLTLLVDDLPIIVGALVFVHTADGRARRGEVVGFEGRRSIVMILGATAGVRAGDRVTAEQSSPTIPVGDRLLGRVIDGLGRPIDGLPHPTRLVPCPLNPDPIVAMRRRRIDSMLTTGVRAIDLMTTVGKGQRLGVFAGPGVGKSTLLSMISRRSAADINIIALIGERGREVREFVEEALGEEGLRRSIVVVSTSDESPLLRVRAAMVACAAAEYFRDRGLDVTLMLDSLTRFAHAQRQIGLAVGEPPATKGYTPSVFAALPALLERAGAVDRSDDSIADATPAPSRSVSEGGAGSGGSGGGGGGARSPASTPSSLRATTPPSRSPTPPEASSTAMSCSLAPSPTRPTSPPSTSLIPSAASPPS